MKDRYKEILSGIIGIVLFAVFVVVVVTTPRRQPEPKEYQIYSYIENETAVYRYMDNLAVYEYSYSGMHLVQLIKGTEQITIVTFKDRDTAIDFAVSYLEGIKGEE